MGETTKSLIKRMRAEIEVRANIHEQLAIGISIGTNNTGLDSKGKPRSAPDDYTKDIDDILDIAEEYTDEVMVVGLTPVDENRTNPVPWDPEFFLNNDRIYDFDLAARGLCRAKEVLFVPVFEEINARHDAGEKMFTPKDGLHPSSKAHDIIAKRVKPKLDSLIQ
jgi:lysophospholipase L1-like esterase